MKRVNKVIYVSVAVLILLCGFTFSAFADFNSNDMVYTNSSGSYYLMRGCTETNEEFRIYVQKYNNNGIVDFVNQYSDQGIVWEYDTRYVDYTFNNTVTLDMLTLINEYYQHLLVDSIYYEFYNKIDFDVFQKSKLCPDYTVYQVFMSGALGYTSYNIDPNNDALTPLVNSINNNGLSNYGIFSTYLYSLMECMYYTEWTSKNYSTETQSIANHLYICQSNSIRDKMVNSIYNLLYYEMGLTDYTYNQILASKWGFSFVGDLSNYTGSMIELYSTYYKNQPVFVFYNSYLDEVTLGYAINQVRTSFDLIKSSYYLNWIPLNILKPLMTFILIMTYLALTLFLFKMAKNSG